MSINELQDLVLGALQVDEEEKKVEKEKRRAAEIFAHGTRDSISFDLFLSDVQETLKLLDTLAAEEVLFRVASLTARSQLLTFRSYSYPNNYVRALYSAIDYLESGDKNNLLEIKDTLEEMVKKHREEDKSANIRSATSSKEKVMDIIEAVWGDDTEDNLVELTAVKRATVKRWMGGANIGSGSYNSILPLAKLFHVLREDRGYTREDLSRWYDEPLADGQTPRQALVNSSWGVPSNLRELMVELGIPSY
jgi:hypothetical protein